MDTPPPQAPVGYSSSSSPPTMTGSLPENRINRPPFSSPLASRLSPQRSLQDQPQRSLQDQLLLSSSRSISSPDTGTGVSSSSPLTQFSSPPGPPIFSSPLRPAAVPFQTSPASPQPVAFSSGSSLPMSSPPNFTNGTAQFLVQHPSTVEETIESPYVQFSAHKVLFYFLFLVLSAKIL
ncbi:early nodulin-like protein 2 [Phalaenopsis equestris]|uniref:early nodulin-like protein 2 n=1 Tax=Phalaenopsis equestris TaxID=78828 RepID=UPI0009E59227|nr:early nodulin-like protein 2 [Phalaenopsis equestris]